MNSTTTTTEDLNSTELKQNAKGEYYWTIKVYGSDNKQIVKDIKDIDDNMKQQGFKTPA